MTDSSAPERILPEIPQVFAIGGWKRSCPVTCTYCGDIRTLTVYSDQQQDDAWCDAQANEMLVDEGWTVTDSGDYCPCCPVPGDAQ